MDTKFVFHQSFLPQILKGLENHYQVLEINGKRMSTYQTRYLDTQDFRFYQEHHNGMRDRVKVRLRKYLDSDLCFLEVKRKNNKGETIKNRIRIGDLSTEMNPEQGEFIHKQTGLNPEVLEPKLRNDFIRITFVSLQLKERVTLDLDLSFRKDDQQEALDPIMIGEIKQEKFSANSPFFMALRQYRIRPMGFSKYCLGSALMYDGLKSNAFKPKILQIKKITDGVLA